MSVRSDAAGPVLTRRVRVYGVVQGVGFRPTVRRHADACGLQGTVCNYGPYVEIILQGTEGALDRFLDLLRTEPPRRAAILKIDVKPVEDAPVFPDFSIIESGKTQGEIFISPDIAICPDCVRELYDPADRRYLHPFINCTCCGPRLTILDGLPYDRERTSMRAFPMCPACREEYFSPASRRYDAQPVCCHDCGPTVYLLDRPERGRDAITAARRVLASGGIIAVKGIGGFHLCCDACSPAAVSLLRNRKRRPAKPFAVMARDMDAARRECILSPEAEALLTGHQKPIVLLPRNPGGLVCAETAPDNPKLGLMLPYAPLQLLLFRYDDDIDVSDCLVMTSANESGAPICRDDDDARRELGPLCDLILSHDRLIRIRADDTVTDLFEGRPYMVRRSRGYAPLPFLLSAGLTARVAAVGGELKNSFCLGAGDLFYPSPYVGDLADVRTFTALRETLSRFEELLEHEPEAVACDLHPRYNSTLAARELGLPLLPVQHHYAHVVSCMAENDFSSPVLGVSFDGTGYGTDGTIWGGELLLSDYHGFTRLSHIAPFPQAGGDTAAREGWRIAVALLPDTEPLPAHLCAPAEAALIRNMIRLGVNTVTSTSCGRLFDAVSALLGIRRVSTFEGEAATQLQFAAERCPASLRRSRFFSPQDSLLSDVGADPFILRTDLLFQRLAGLHSAGEAPEALAWAFHLGLAELVAAACRRARDMTGVSVAALTGGCFQNLLLLKLCVERLRADGFRVLLHSLVPPNDGGIALGQAVAASQALADAAAGGRGVKSRGWGE